MAACKGTNFHKRFLAFSLILFCELFTGDKETKLMDASQIGSMVLQIGLNMKPNLVMTKLIRSPKKTYPKIANNCTISTGKELTHISVA